MSEMPVQGAAVYADLGGEQWLDCVQCRLAQKHCRAPGGRLSTAAVQNIVVNGSAYTDAIDLWRGQPKHLSESALRSDLRNVGNDTIRGSDIADVIFGVVR